MRGKKKAILKGVCMELFITYGERTFSVAHIVDYYVALLAEDLLDWLPGDGPYVKLSSKALELIRS